jgi:hypothetical protein
MEVRSKQPRAVEAEGTPQICTAVVLQAESIRQPCTGTPNFNQNIMLGLWNVGIRGFQKGKLDTEKKAIVFDELPGLYYAKVMLKGLKSVLFLLSFPRFSYFHHFVIFLWIFNF